MNRVVERVKSTSSPHGKKVVLQSRSSYSDTFKNSTHDYAVLAVPFSILKKWRIDGEQLLREEQRELAKVPNILISKAFPSRCAMLSAMSRIPPPARLRSSSRRVSGSTMRILFTDLARQPLVIKCPPAIWSRAWSRLANTF